jgi:hypothetical protein
MSDFNLPDFRQLLRQSSGRPEGPAIDRPLRVAAQPSTREDWPVLAAAVGTLSGLYTVTADAFAGLRLFDGSRQLDDGEVCSGRGPWVYAAELPLTTPTSPASPATPQFVLVDLEVLFGEIGLTLLTADGSGLAGERTYFGCGRHAVQLVVPRDVAWRGVVFCNHAGPDATARFRVHQADLAVLTAGGCRAAA